MRELTIANNHLNQPSQHLLLLLKQVLSILQLSARELQTPTNLSHLFLLKSNPNINFKHPCKQLLLHLLHLHNLLHQTVHSLPSSISIPSVNPSATSLEASTKQDLPANKTIPIFLHKILILNSVLSSSLPVLPNLTHEWLPRTPPRALSLKNTCPSHLNSTLSAPA